MADVDDGNYSDYSADGSWCEISVNDDNSVDSFVSVDYEESLTNPTLSSTTTTSSSDVITENKVDDDDHKNVVMESDVMIEKVDDDDDHKKVVMESDVIIEKVDDDDEPEPVKEDDVLTGFHDDKYGGYEIIPPDDNVTFGCGFTQSEVPMLTSEDPSLGELIENAQLQLDRKIRCRDLFRAQIALQEWKVRGHKEALEAASKKTMEARELVQSKELEIIHVLNVINRFKDIEVVQDIDTKILELEKWGNNEYMPLKDEKNLIREIKQLMRVRDMGSRYDVQEALDRKKHINELAEDLKAELGVLLDDVSTAEKAAQSVKKTYEKEAEREKEMWAQYKLIQDSCEEAVAYLEGLKKRLDDENIDFLTRNVIFRSHREKETEKEEIDAVLKGLRDLEKEVCNDAFMGGGHHLYTLPAGHQVFSHDPFFQPMINMPVDWQIHDAERAQMQAVQWAQKLAEAREEVHLAMERHIHDAMKAQMQHRAEKEAEAREELLLAMEMRIHDAERARMQVVQWAQKEAEAREEVLLAMERKIHDAMKAQMQAEYRAQAREEVCLAMERQKHDAQRAQMQAEQRAQKEAEAREELLLAMEMQKHDAQRAQLRMDQCTDQKEAEQNSKEKLKRWKRKRADYKSCINNEMDDLTILNGNINILILLAVVYGGLMLTAFLAAYACSMDY